MNNAPVTNCTICSSPSAYNYHLIDGFQFVKCNDCDFVFTHPMPSQDELNVNYTGESSVTKTFFSQSSSRKRRAFFKALSLRRYVKGGKRAIDIGCGGGFIVEGLRKMGADAYGFDINQNNIAYAQHNFPKCRFFVDSYAEIEKMEEPFDFVFSSEVIEHVGDLDVYMRLLKKITREGGYIYITTPDYGSPNRPENVLEWDPFGPPEHIQYFSEKNLSILFENHGFSVVRKMPDKKTGLKMLFRK